MIETNVKIVEYVGVNHTHKLCWIQLTKNEAIKLIHSLTSQIINDNSNTSRLESKCIGDCDELSIVIKDNVYD